METKIPKVSVIMPVYNGEKYLREAIDSILNQTFTDWELICINDGSTDNSVEIIRSYTEPRIRLIDNEKNKGLAITRNRGLDEARGIYIANLDCDDRSYPDRLMKQVSFLDENPDFGLVGSYIETIDKNGEIVPNGTWIFSAPAKEIPIIMVFSNYFAQSATMIRKSFLPSKHYRLDLPPAEDYDLWIRLAENSKVYNLPEVLTQIRNHGENTSLRHKTNYPKIMPLIYRYQLESIGVSFTVEELDRHYLFSVGELTLTTGILDKMKDWFTKLHLANIKSNRYNRILFTKSLVGRWYLLCRKIDHQWWQPKKIFWQASFLWGKNFSIREKIELFFMSIFHLTRTILVKHSITKKMKNKIKYILNQLKFTSKFREKLNHNFHELTWLERLIYFLTIRWHWEKNKRFFFEGHWGLPGQMYIAERKALYESILSRNPKQCFEIGTYTGGGSTFFIAQAMAHNKHGQLITMEENSYYHQRASRYYREKLSHLAPFINFVLGQTAEKLLDYVDKEQGVDSLFLDGAENEKQTIEQYNLFLPYFRANTLLILHDWNTEKTKSIKPLLLADKSWELQTEIFPPSSVGLAIFKKK